MYFYAQTEIVHCVNRIKIMVNKLSHLMLIVEAFFVRKKKIFYSHNASFAYFKIAQRSVKVESRCEEGVKYAC